MSTTDPSWDSPEHFATRYTPVFQLVPEVNKIFGQTDHPDYSEALLSQIDIYGMPLPLAIEIHAGTVNAMETVFVVDEAGRLIVNNQTYPGVYAVGEIRNRNGQPTQFRINSFVELDLRHAI